MYTVYATDREYGRLIEVGDAAVAADQPFQALEAYSVAIALRPDSMLAHLKRGVAYRSRGELDEAVRDLRRAADLDPTATQPHELLADCQLALARHDRAAESYEAFLALDNRSARVWYKLGLARYRAGHLTDAVNSLRRAVALDRASAETHLLLGLALRDAGERQESRTMLEAAVKLAPSLMAARDALAALYTATGDADRAIDHLEALAALDPTRPERAVALGLAHARARRHETAVVVLSRAVQRFPAEPLVYAALGRVWLDIAQSRGDAVALKKAIEALKAATGHSDATGDAFSDLGHALFASGDVAGAERALRQATSRVPVRPESYRLLASIYARTRRIADARDALVRYAALAGDAATGSEVAAQIADYSLRLADRHAAARWITRAEASGAPRGTIQALKQRLDAS
jgi:tetratricopeptide (TPR) repeat protein